LKKISHSAEPRKAPADFRQLDPRVVTSDGDGLWITWHGSGEPSSEACDACGNTEGNIQIYENSGVSYPNGNSWDDREILCGSCGQFTLVLEFEEG
jgi:hypothetical protein